MNMRLSELSGKEIVDLKKAERLGVLGQTDLEFNEKTGQIYELVIPTGKRLVKNRMPRFACHGNVSKRSALI